MAIKFLVQRANSPEPLKTSRGGDAVRILFGLPLITYLALIAQHSFIFPYWFADIGTIVVLIACGIYRVLYKRRSHLMSWLLLWLCLCDPSFTLSTYSYLRGWAWPFMLFSFLVAFFVAAHFSGLIIAAARAAIIVCVIGFVIYMTNRGLLFSDEFGSCDPKNIDPIFHRVDTETQAYDGLLLKDPFAVIAGYGTNQGVAVKLLPSGRELWRLPIYRCQRMNFAPDGQVIAPDYGHFGNQESVYLLEVQAKKKRKILLGDECTNAIESLVVGDELFTLCERSKNIMVTKYTSGDLIDIIKLPPKITYSMAADYSRKKIWVSYYLGSSIARIDAPTHKVDAIVKVGFCQMQVKIAPDGTVFVLLPLQQEVVLVDPEKLKIKARYKAGRGVRDLELLPDRDVMFVVNYFDKTLQVLRMSSGKRLGQFRVYPLSRGINLSEDKSLLAVFTGCGVLIAKVDDLLMMSSGKSF